MLKIIDESGFLRFTGFMGHEGHVPFVPLDRGSPAAEFAAAQRRYAVRWLAYLDVFRGGQLVDQWPTFQPGIRLA